MRVVITSVQYADFLADTLPAWRAVLRPSAEIAVVTEPDDLASQKIADAAGVSVCVTDVWQADGAKFNRGSALDLAFGFRGNYAEPPKLRETCLSIDADVYPVGPFPDRETMRSGTLYGCPRHRCETRAHFLEFCEGKIALQTLPVILQRQRAEAKNGGAADTERAARACLGFFQLFRYQPGIHFGPSHTAGKYDIDFRRHFQRRRAVENFAVLHLGLMDRQNWRGRTVPAWQES